MQTEQLVSYDDFYKFVTGIGAALIIVSVYITTQGNLLAFDLNSGLRTGPGLIGIGMLICGMVKWYNKQKILDELEKSNLQLNDEKILTEILKQDQELVKLKLAVNTYNKTAETKIVWRDMDSVKRQFSEGRKHLIKSEELK